MLPRAVPGCLPGGGSLQQANLSEARPPSLAGSVQSSQRMGRLDRRCSFVQGSCVAILIPSHEFPTVADALQARSDAPAAGLWSRLQ